MPNTVILTFEQVYSGDENQSIDDYLSGVSRTSLLKIGTLLIHFNSLFLNDAKVNNEELLNRWFGHYNAPERNRILSVLASFQNAIGADIDIITTQGCLVFFEHIFDHISQEADSKTQAQIEIDVFKAYLLINQPLINDADIIAVTCTQHLAGFSKTVAMTLCRSLGYWDILNYDIKEILLVQLVKLCHFIDYSQTDASFTYLNSIFLNKLECSSWAEFLVKFFPIILAELGKGDKTITYLELPKDDDYERNERFLTNYMLSNEISITDTDFRIIRNAPIYRDEEGQYVIIYNLFLVEKLYKSLIFNLKSLNQSLDSAHKISDLNSLLCQNFTENHIFYKILTSIFTYHDVLKTGEQIKLTGVVGEPDLYCRFDNTILLFESKDIQIESGIKTSNNYGAITEALKKKLYFDLKANGNVKPKAIKQLISNLIKVLKKSFHFDTSYNTDKLKVYSIIVVYERIFEAPGLNRLLISWFKEELLAQGLSINDSIRPVVLVNFDLFIFHKPVVDANPTHFCEIIEDYFTMLENEKIEPLERLQSFNHFFRNRFRMNYSQLASNAGDTIIQLSQSHIGAL